MSLRFRQFFACLVVPFAMPRSMVERRSEVSEFKSHNYDFRSEMSDATFTADAVRKEMRGHVEAVASLAPNDSRKAALAFAAKLLRLPFGRARSLYYGEARRIDAHEADQIRAYVAAAQKLIQARADLEALRDEFVAHASPALACLAPRELAADEVSREAEAVAKHGR